MYMKSKNQLQCRDQSQTIVNHQDHKRGRDYNLIMPVHLITRKSSLLDLFHIHYYYFVIIFYNLN